MQTSVHSRQADLEWRFHRSRERYKALKAHYGELLPQLSGLVSPPMLEGIECVLEERIGKPLRAARAEMLETFEQLEQIKQTSKDASAMSIAEQVTRTYQAHRAESPGGQQPSRQQAMLFEPGAPMNVASPCGTNWSPAVGDDEAVMPGSDPLLYGFDEPETEAGITGEESQPDLRPEPETEAHSEQVVRGYHDLFVSVPLRRPTLRRTHARPVDSGESSDLESKDTEDTEEFAFVPESELGVDIMVPGLADPVQGAPARRAEFSRESESMHASARPGPGASPEIVALVPVRRASVTSERNPETEQLDEGEP